MMPMIHQPEKEETFEIEQSFCESKRLTGYLALSLALAFLGDIVYSSVHDGMKGFTLVLFFILMISALLSLFLYLYPASCVEIGKNGFTYRRGKKKWSASWKEIEEINVSHDGRDIQIKTDLGSTKMIALSVIKKKGGPSRAFPFRISFNLAGFLKDLALHKNEDGRELLSILEERSGKKTKQGAFTGLEKIR